MLKIVSNLFVLIFALVFVYWGIKFVEFGWYQESELAELPMPFIFVGSAARRRELGDLPGRNLLRQYPHRGREGRRGRELWLQTRPYSHRAKHLGVREWPDGKPFDEWDRYGAVELDVPSNVEINKKNKAWAADAIAEGTDGEKRSGRSRATGSARSD